MAPALIVLARPWQWYKNLVVAVAFLFSRAFVDQPGLWPWLVLVILAFCLLSSATYAWNDVVDAAQDRAHPKKRDRPVASGRVSPWAAILWGGILATVGLAALALTNGPTLLLGVTFLVLQVAYNAFLKDQVIWDVLLIGVGFVVRALAGATLIQVVPTVWLILCTFLFALFLAFGKRRHELVLLAHDGGDARHHRAVLGEYTVELVEQMTIIVAALLLASYVLYAALGTVPGGWMMTTIPFAVYGVFRYLYLVKRRGHGDEPELVVRDLPTVLNAAAWTVAVALVLLGVPQGFFAWLQRF